MMDTERFPESVRDDAPFDLERVMVEDLESCGPKKDGRCDESVARANSDSLQCNVNGTIVQKKIPCEPSTKMMKTVTTTSFGKIDSCTEKMRLRCFRKVPDRETAKITKRLISQLLQMINS